MIWTMRYQILTRWLYLLDTIWSPNNPGPVFSYTLRYIVGFWLVEMTISTNQKPTIYRNLYENTEPGYQTSGTVTRAVNGAPS